MIQQEPKFALTKVQYTVETGGNVDEVNRGILSPHQRRECTGLTELLVVM